MKLSDLGEFGLIERLTRILGNPKRDLIIGIGDDAAVWKVGREKPKYLIATTDTMVEGVHFERELAPWADIGWKALAVNVSDVAAMGGEPTFALVTLALPTDVAADDVELIYAGLAECANDYRVTIAGGDVVRAPQISITIALFGEAGQRGDQPLLLRRDAARVGDLVVVTGTLGDSAGGLRKLREGADADDPLARRHLWPRPSLMSGGLSARMGVECATDVSDGLLQDLGHICERSGFGAVLHGREIPISPELRAAYPDDALELACTGGEDYELLMTADRDILDALRPMLVDTLTVIGEVVDDSEHRVRLLDDAGHEVIFESGGWDAFR